MSNALLLRLFTSEYFNAWIAISYIFRYPDNVGIQHYLCTQLRKFPIAEIEFFLPQLMHLLITRPTESVALECYIIDACEKSTHIAVMCLWYLQAYMSDLGSTPSHPSFQLCKRVFNQCQSIVFSEEEQGYATQQVRENTFPALVGMGALLAGIGQPLATKPVGSVALAQGRKERPFTFPDISFRNSADIKRKQSFQSDSQLQSNVSILREKHFTVSLEDLHRGKAFSVSRYLKQAQQKINNTVRSTLVSHDSDIPTQLLNGGGMDPVNMKAMAQSSVPTPVDDALGQSPPKRSYSMDYLPQTEDDIVNSSESDDDEIYALAKLSLDDRRHLLRSNYFRSEMQFLLALVDIATRLVIVPKRARLSALHAELTLLNHNLPAEICMPLWCPATVDRPYHHRIVRISPTDAVVLNSAERAPYLLMIEVLDDELSLENGFKSSLSKIKKQGHRHSSGSMILKRKEVVDDIGDLGSPTSIRSFDFPSSTSSSTLDTVEHVQEKDENLFNAEEFAEKMKTAAILLAQLQKDHPQQENTALRVSTDGIRQKIIAEMMALEDDRMEKMALEGVDSGIGGGGGEGAGNEGKLDDESRVAMVVNKEDPSAAVFAEKWETKKERIRASSPYGHLPNWRLISVIVKNGADLRQEQFAIQLIREMQKIWDDTKVNVWVQYVRILVTSDDSGLIETIKNSISIHSIKKEAYIRKWNKEGQVFTLYDYYQRRWGTPSSSSFKKAQDAFMRSLAGYSIASYLMQIKDRHNGNLLIDDAGHIIHIDFGFILSNSPGSVGFEMAPFKLPQEYIDILGGVNSEKFAEFKALTKATFIALRKHSDNILLLTEMMSKDSKLPCFVNGQHALAQLRDRFQLHLTDPQVEAFVEKLIMSSCCNVFTRLYDTYQYYSQGVL
ncbi:kinase-like domain-containing protein [Mucor mucedo]|uniref:kinase-like domain-containing protein n=1 Tax=Mucor mucedo TaxID=29922 RepID=UPI00221EB4F7|nr:kinase-like domain-containing protein [Mucor mucedo]KAI7889458.1 kinase-like domain-containing protein [Mucor mucedo]